MVLGAFRQRTKQKKMLFLLVSIDKGMYFFTRLICNKDIKNERKLIQFR